MCKNPEAGKVLDTFEKRIKGKCDEYGSEWEMDSREVLLFLFTVNLFE